MKDKKLPSFCQPCFWDVDVASLDPDKYPQFIIKRLLDRGNTRAIKWLFSNFSTEKIKETLVTSRDLSPKTANFWADVFSLDQTKIPCLQKPYSRTPFGLSS